MTLPLSLVRRLVGVLDSACAVGEAKGHFLYIERYACLNRRWFLSGFQVQSFGGVWRILGYGGDSCTGCRLVTWVNASVWMPASVQIPRPQSGTPAVDFLCQSETLINGSIRKQGTSAKECVDCGLLDLFMNSAIAKDGCRVTLQHKVR